jgi:hypothetical protein
MSFFAELGLSTAFTMISLAPMVPDWIKGNPQPQTKINVMVGLPPLNPEQQQEKDKLYKELSYGGCAPEMSLFNANGDRVGYSRNWNCKHVIDQNSLTDVWADYFKKGNTEKAEYITVSASGTDAICISAITVTFPASSDTYAFLPGEVAAVCNNHKPEYNYYWSESATSVQFRSESGTTKDARPKCLWIDKPDDDGEKATHCEGFQVHLPDFKDGKRILHTCATHWLALVPTISWILQCVQRSSAQRRRMARISPWIRYRHALRLRKIARQTPEFAKTIALHTRSDMISSGCTTRGVQLTIHGINVSKLRYPNIV